MLNNTPINNTPIQYGFNHSFFYDNDLSQMWYDDFCNNEDNKYILSLSEDYKVIFASKELADKPYYKISTLRRIKKSELIDLLDEYNEWHSLTSDSLKQEYIDELLEITNEDYYTKHYENASRWYDLESDFVARGNHQGDAIAIKLVSDKQHKFDYKITCEHIENIYFNAPISCNIEITDLNNDEVIDEIYLDEYVKDCYKYDKSEVIEILNKHYSDKPYFKALMFYVENSVSDYPSCN